MHTEGSFCLRQPHFIHDAAYDPELPNVRRCVCVCVSECVCSLWEMWLCHLPLGSARCEKAFCQTSLLPGPFIRPSLVCVCVCLHVLGPFIFRECMCCLPAPGPQLTNSSKPLSIDHNAQGHLLRNYDADTHGHTQACRHVQI